MPPRSSRTTSTKAPRAPRGADPEPAGAEAPTESPQEEELPSAALPAPSQGEPARALLELPFLTVSLSRPPRPPADSGSEPGGPVPADAPSLSGSSGLQRWLFYGGIAALGAVGAVDWPVAAAIAAGAYIAARTRGSGQAPTT